MNISKRKKTIVSVVAFSILVTAVAWLAPFLGGSPSSPGLGFILWGTAPMLVSLLMRLVNRDWSDLGFKPEIRQNILWYGISILAYPLIMLLALLIGTMLSVSSLAQFSIGDYMQIALTALPIFFIFAIFEELGWRGYLAPKLANLGINSYLAAALLALVWTGWHLPYIRELSWIYSSEEFLSFIPRYYLLLFAFSVLYGEIRKQTGSFWPAVLMHAVSNAFGHPLAADYVRVADGKDYLGSVSTGLFIIVLTFLLGIAIQQWRMKKAHISEALS
jgi:membrane protease YdiL (CAAX protease family)